MENKTFFKTMVSMIVVAFVVTGCGGGGGEGGGGSVSSGPSLSAGAAMTSTTYEKDKVVLNAASVLGSIQTSSTYKWTQTTGTNVELVDANAAVTYFVSPEVSADTTLKFDLEVSQNGTPVSLHKVDIKILNKSITGNYQQLFSSDNTITSSNTVAVSYTYNQLPATQSTSGLVLKLFWDDTKLTFNNITNAYATDYQNYSAIQNDNVNEDNDTSTNKYVTISWYNISTGVWGVSGMPVNLFQANFTKKDTGVTLVKLISGYDSPSLDFLAEPVLVNLK
jgi:hypothetical protein